MARVSHIKNHEEEFNEELCRLWLDHMREDKLKFREPLLNHIVAEKVKVFCVGLQQDDHVFLCAVEILEQYVAEHNAAKLSIEEPFLTVLCATFLAGKLVGDVGDMRPGALGQFYEQLMHRPMEKRTMRRVEVHILNVLDFKLPMNTHIDDMKTLVHAFIEPLDLKINIANMCKGVLCFYVVNRVVIFHKLCRSYSQSPFLNRLFKRLYMNRYYVPSAVIIMVFKILALPTQKVDINALCELFGKESTLPTEHIDFFARTLLMCWRRRHNATSRRSS